MRVRPTKILTAAGVAVAIGVVATWAADPAWARSAGLDVWNVGRLEDQLRESRAEAAHLETREAVLFHLFEQNQLLVGEVAAGRRPLADAAGRHWRANKDRPGYAVVLNLYFRGPTPEAKAAHQILWRIEMDPNLSSGVRAAALARGRVEYAAAFGVPAS